MTVEHVHTTQDGDMLDDICWRHYGRQSGAVEAVLDANQGLAARGAIYPAGQSVPLVQIGLSKLPVRDWVRLWS
ncbi:MAG: phage tail protein [Sphingobacteriia bacterium]|nr:phage tail protein [Sphingobacteriia bacterium]